MAGDARVTMAVKDLFFDRPRVMALLGEQERARLMALGAEVRQRARRSLRFRKDRRLASAPGAPPFVHQRGCLKLIFYGYDRSSGDVIAGPVGFPASQTPELLEKGGQATIEEAVPPRERRPAASEAQRAAARRLFLAGRIESPAKVVRRRIAIKPRPTMGLALEAIVPRMPRAFAGMVR